MTRVIRTALVVALAVVSLSAAPANIEGQWQLTVELAMGTGNPVVTFKQDGEKITGSYEGRYGASKLEGTVKENDVRFTVFLSVEGQEMKAYYTGTYAADKMSGTVEYDGNVGDGTWAAVRLPAKK